MANNLTRIGYTLTIPAKPGVPYRPAYTIVERFPAQDIIINDNVTWMKVVVFGDSAGPGGGYASEPVETWFPIPNDGESLFWVKDVTVTRTRTVPAQPAIPGVPERRVFTPPRGWNAYGRSVGSLFEGRASFRISPNAAGIAIGLAQPARPRVGYSHIPQGFLFTGGVIRNLRTNFSYGPYGGSDVMRLRREGSTLTLLKNGDELATEALNYSTDQPLHLSAALYGPQDAVLDPTLTPAPRTGASEARLPRLTAATGDKEHAGSVALLSELTASSGVLSRSEAVLSALLAQSSDKLVAVSYARLTPMQAETYGGSWTVERNSESFAAFSPLNAASVMLNGELGSSEAVLLGMLGGSSDRPLGQSSVTLRPLAARSWDSPVGLASASPTFALRVALTPSTVVNARIDFSVGLDFEITEDAASQESLTFTLGLDVPMTYSTIDEVAIEPVFWFSVPIEVPGAFTDTWVMNLRTGASTRYEGYPFDALANIGGKYLAAGVDGLYELDGDDDAGEPINAYADFGVKSFGTDSLKRLEQIYLGISSSGQMYVKVSAEGAAYTYTMREFSEYLQTQRVTVGKGMRANYFGFEIGNVAGADFELSSVNVLVAESARRI